MSEPKKNTTLSVSETVADDMRKSAKQLGISLHEYVNIALTFFKEHGEINVTASKRETE